MLGLTLPWASRSTVGTPKRTNLVNNDCSILENFWKAIFFITGGNWWWSPIMIQRFNRLYPSCGFCRRSGMKVSISNIWAASSIRMLSYLKPASTRSFRLRAACVHVIAIIFASLTHKYLVLSSPDLSNSNALNSSSWVNIFCINSQHPSAEIKHRSSNNCWNEKFGLKD